jgi:hypothetical protein
MGNILFDYWHADEPQAEITSIEDGGGELPAFLRASDKPFNTLAIPESFYERRAHDHFVLLTRRDIIIYGDRPVISVSISQQVQHPLPGHLIVVGSQLETIARRRFMI